VHYYKEELSAFLIASAQRRITQISEPKLRKISNMKLKRRNPNVPDLCAQMVRISAEIYYYLVISISYSINHAEVRILSPLTCRK
jgi:hypothetical protein